MVVGDLVHVCEVRFGRFKEHVYLVTMHFVRPWYILPSCPWSFNAWISCLPIYLR